MQYMFPALLAVSLLQVQSPQPAPTKETIVVTGTATPIPLSEADRDVTALPLTSAQRLLFQSFLDLLQDDAAIDLRQRGPGIFQADLSIRGASFGQTLILLDGMRLNDVQSGHLNLDSPAPFETISSVEVLKGAGSTLYGSDAVGGVVNLRTSRPEASELRVRLGAGNLGLGKIGFDQEHLLGSVVHAKLLEQLGFDRDRSTGFMPNRDYRNLALSSLTSATTKLGVSSVYLAYSDRPYGADRFYGNYPSWERDKTWFASAHQQFGEQNEANFAFRRHTDLFVLYRDRPQIYANRHSVEGYQGNFRRTDKLPFHATLSYGVEGLAESIESTNLGTHSRKRASAYALYDLRSARRFSLSAGIREEIYGSRQVATSPTVSAGAWVNGRLKLRAASSRAFRLPSYTDLYYKDPANAGNPNLKPESATSYEGGADLYLLRNIHAGLTVFHRRDTNGIDYVRAGVTDIWQATNFTNVHFTGVEASTVFDLPRQQHLSLAFTALRGIDANADVLLSKYAFNYPSQRAVVEYRGELGGHVIARTRLGVVNRIARSPYGLWDASASRATGHLRPFVQLTNIAGTVYQEIPGVVMPQRSFIAGIEYRLGRSSK